MKWEVTFQPMIVEADNEDDAIDTAVERVIAGELEEDTVEQWEY